MLFGSTPLTRRAASALITAALCKAPPAPAIEIPERTEQQRLEQSLYAAPAPVVQSFRQQVSDAISIRSMRGVWSLREISSSGSVKTGTMTFRGAVTEDKGSVSYTGDAVSGRGPWIIKPDGFGRNPNAKGGMIEQKAIWKLRRSGEGGGTYTYAGRIDVTAAPKIEGEIIELSACCWLVLIHHL